MVNTSFNTSGLIITNPPTQAETLLDLTPFFDEAAMVGSSSFDVNGVIFLLSGSVVFSYNDSVLPYTLIFATGSDVTSVVTDIVAAYSTINNTIPFNQFLSDISIFSVPLNLDPGGSKLSLTANTAGSTGNSYYYVSSSVVTNLTGGWNNSATGSFSGFSVFFDANLINVRDFNGNDLTSDINNWTFNNTQTTIPLYLTNVEVASGTLLLYPISTIIPQQ
jgi:hypothetical protein